MAICNLNMEMYLAACICIMHEYTLSGKRFRLQCLFEDIIQTQLV